MTTKMFDYDLSIPTQRELCLNMLDEIIELLVKCETAFAEVRFGVSFYQPNTGASALTYKETMASIDSSSRLVQQNMERLKVQRESLPFIGLVNSQSMPVLVEASNALVQTCSCTAKVYIALHSSEQAQSLYEQSISRLDCREHYTLPKTGGGWWKSLTNFFRKG